MGHSELLLRLHHVSRVTQHRPRVVANAPNKQVDPLPCPFYRLEAGQKD